MIKNENKIKDKKIQFYLPQKQENSNIWYKQYPYSREIFESGGLWAYVRDKTQIEKIQASMTIDKSILECRLNYNPLITSQHKAIYKNQIYDVSLPDNYEGYMEETKFTLTLSADNNTYTGAEVYGQT